MTDSYGGSLIITPDPLDTFDGGGGRVATNLVTNPSFEIDTNGWTAVDGTVTRVLGDDVPTSTFGLWLMQVESPSGGGGFSAVTPSGASGFPVVARSHYHVLTWFLVRSADTYIELPSIFVGWYDAAGSLFAGGRVVECPFTDLITGVDAVVVAPPGAAYLQVQLAANSTGDAVFYVDAVLVTAGAALEPYFDGDTVDDASFAYDWTGTPHNSASTRTLL